jgi:hypothetical protein
MNRKQKISLVMLAGIALAVAYWTGYVHGGSNLSPFEQYISVALPVILIWTLAKLTFAFCFGRASGRRSSGGSAPPGAPSAGVRVPTRPGGPPVIHCEHAISI